MSPNPSHLVTAPAAGLLAVAIVTAAVQLPLLPEVDHVDQQLAAFAADEAGWVPQLVVAGALSVHRRLATTHGQLAVAARLRGGGRETEREREGRRGGDRARVSESESEREG